MEGVREGGRKGVSEGGIRDGGMEGGKDGGKEGWRKGRMERWLLRDQQVLTWGILAEARGKQDGAHFADGKGGLKSRVSGS